MQKKKKKHSLLKTGIALILGSLVLMVGIIVIALWVKLNKIDFDKIDPDDIVKNTDESGNEVEIEGYTNMVLFGLDARSNTQLDAGTHADTIIILSLNNKTGEIRLLSVYRDTYLQTDASTDTYRKITEGYFYGGALGALNALNTNLDLDIEDYVSVNWAAVANAINILGGVEITVTEEELPYLNSYVTETVNVTGIASTQLSAAGTQTLDGVQAVAYCRIRYVGLDYQRTERQRTVITQMLNKAQSAGIGTLNTLMDEILPEIKTSLSQTDLLGYLTKLTTFEVGYSQGFPYTKFTMTIPNRNDCVVAQDLRANVIQLHQELFGDTDYTPSSTVLLINDRINADTGQTSSADTQAAQ